MISAEGTDDFSQVPRYPLPDFLNHVDHVEHVGLVGVISCSCRVEVALCAPPSFISLTPGARPLTTAPCPLITDPCP